MTDSTFPPEEFNGLDLDQSLEKIINESLSDNLKADREVVLAAVKSQGEALKYASDELQADPELIEISELI